MTWLGLHAFREVFAAFSRKDRGFTTCKLDMEKALLKETAGPSSSAASSVAGSADDNTKMGTGGLQNGGSAGGPGAGDAGAKNARRRDGDGNYKRLQHVVRSPDALSLLRTLTT